MSRISFLIIFIVFAHQLAYALESIRELVWNSRIILVRATAESEELLNTLKKLDHEIQDRDIYWFVFSGKSIETNYQGDLLEKFYSDTLNKYFTNIETNVVLIGKDGDIKRKAENLDLQSLFDLIDTMPMRQLEMRQ